MARLDDYFSYTNIFKRYIYIYSNGRYASTYNSECVCVLHLNASQDLLSLI